MFNQLLKLLTPNRPAPVKVSHQTPLRVPAPPSPTPHRSPRRPAAREPLEQRRTVYSQNAQCVEILAPLARGGEGCVHTVAWHPDKVVKVYHERVLENAIKAEETRRKIAAMCAMDALKANESLAWPQIGVFDERKKWIGYAMRGARGKVLHLLCSPFTTTREFPGWDRADLVQTALQIANGLVSLHRRGILAGDLSTGNFMVDPSSRKVVFVDCDSYHLGSVQGTRFPCRVRTLLFSPPELAADPFARMSVETCVITYGGEVEVAMPFTPSIDIDAIEVPGLVADGYTPMGEAITLGLHELETRRKLYKSNGISAYRPWMILMTDGMPNDPWEEPAAQARALAEQGRMVYLGVAIGENADMHTLETILSHKWPPKTLRGLRFRGFFQWLSDSLRDITSSDPSEAQTARPTSDWSF